MTLKLKYRKTLKELAPGTSFSLEEGAGTHTHMKIRDVPMPAGAPLNCVYLPDGQVIYLPPGRQVFPGLGMAHINDLNPGDVFVWDGEPFLKMKETGLLKAVRLSDGLPCTPTGTLVGRLPDDWRVNE